MTDPQTESAAAETAADLCIIGGGPGGLLVAAAAGLLERPTVLIERGRMGGASLHTGALPMAALGAAARRASLAGTAAAFGVALGAPAADFARVKAHIEAVIAAVAPKSSAERLTGLGCEVIAADARFLAPDLVAAGARRIRARRFVIATGALPVLPAIEGLAAVPYLTTESVLALERRPEHLLVIGGGPSGIELAQAFARLGAKVSLVERAALLGGHDAEAVAVVRAALLASGVALYEGRSVRAVASREGGVALVLADGATLQGSHLLIAAGRAPALAGLGLEAAGVAYDAGGIRVDRRLRTSNRRIYAVGDVTGGPHFTHRAAHHAGIVVRNALFRLPAKAERETIPSVTYSDPALAEIGLGEAEARAAHGAIRILRWAIADSDRAQAECQPDGFVKVIATPRGRVLGATIVAAGAGELILPWALALRARLKLAALAGLIAPYPSLGEAGRSAAGSFFTRGLFSPRSKALARFLARFG